MLSRLRRENVLPCATSRSALCVRLGYVYDSGREVYLINPIGEAVPTAASAAMMRWECMLDVCLNEKIKMMKIRYDCYSREREECKLRDLLKPVVSLKSKRVMSTSWHTSWSFYIRIAFYCTQGSDCSRC